MNTELGRPANQQISLNDSAVRGLSGQSSGAVSFAALRGKSARSLVINIISSRTVTNGIGDNPQSYTQIVFEAVMSDGSTPSSYNWYGDVAGSTKEITWRGPSYDTMGFTTQVDATAWINAVVDGVTYTANRYFTYTQGDAV